MTKKIRIMLLVIGSIFLVGCGNKEVSDEKDSKRIHNVEETEELGRSGTKKNYEDVLFIPFKEGDKWGCMTLDGEIVIEPQYEMLFNFCEGLALIRENGKFGYINKNNEIIVKPQYDDARDFQEGCAGVCIKKIADQEFEKWGFINKNGELIFEIECDEIGGYFSEGLANVCIDGKWGYIDTEGQFAIAPEYDMATEFQDEAALVKDGGSQRFIRRENFWTIMGNQNPDIELISYYEGLAYVQRIVERYDDGMSSVTYGYINDNGEQFIACDVAEEFSEGLAAVKINGLWGYMNVDGELVIEPQYEMVGPFSEGLAVASSQKENYLIDTDGTIIFQTDRYDLVFYGGAHSSSTNRVKSGMVVAEDKNESGRYYVLDVNGNILLEEDKVNGSGIWIFEHPSEEVSFIYRVGYDEDTKDAWAEILACIDRDGNVVWDRRNYDD